MAGHALVAALARQRPKPPNGVFAHSGDDRCRNLSAWSALLSGVVPEGSLHDGVRRGEVVQANCACLMRTQHRDGNGLTSPHVLGSTVATPERSLRSSHGRCFAKVKLRAIHPHAVHDDREFASNRNAGFLYANALGKLDAPCPQHRPLFRDP